MKDHIDKTAIVNAKGATWHIDKGSLLFGSEGAVPKFTNEGVLSKKATDPTDESFIDLAFEQKGEGSVAVEGGTLTFRGGGTFEGPGGFVLKSNTSTLRLASPPNANQAVYQVLSGTVTAASIPPAVSPAVSATFAIDDGATLSILAGAEFVARLSLSPDRDHGGLDLNDGGELFVAGVFRNEGDFTWKGGRITTSAVTGGAAVFSNESFLSIEGKALKILAGRLANRAGPIFDSPPRGVDLRGTLTLAGDGRLENERAGSFNIFDDGEVAAVGSDAVFTNKGTLTVRLSDDATTDMTATIATRFDNTFGVAVSQINGTAPATETLRVTGTVTQLDGTSLTGGAWLIFPMGVLDLGGRAIKQLGSADGPEQPFPTVGLFGNAVFLNFGLERIEKTGSLLVASGHSLILPGALDTSGKLFVTESGTGLQVNGDFDQRGRLVLGRLDLESGETGTTPQIQVHNGNVNFHKGSETIINGDFKVFTRGKYITVNGDLRGDGNINGEELTVIVERGRVRVGNSPGTLTIDADYTQSAEGTLEIEIGGTDVGTNQDQLVINGNADLGGTIVFKFIDGFAPRAGDRFDSVAVAGTLAGRFDNVRIVNLAPGFEFEVNNDGGMVSMTALTDGVYTPPDCDQDGDVDLSDFLALTACFTGPGAGPLLLECSCSDLDNDNDVDLADLIAFQATFTGAR